MRNFLLTPICGLLLVVAACSSDSSDPGGGEIRSQADVQRFFEAIVPDLIAAFTEAANQQSFNASALSSITDKAVVQCPEGGMLDVDLSTGQGALTACTVRGTTISASLMLSVTPPPPSYVATFSGTLMVTGTFTGTVEVISATIRWTDPPSEGGTSWDVMVTVNGETFTVSSADGPVDSNCPNEAVRFVFTPFDQLDPENPQDITVDTCAFFDCQTPAGDACALQVFDIDGDDRFLQFSTTTEPFMVNFNFCGGFDFVIDEPGTSVPGTGRGFSSTFGELTGRQFGEQISTPFATGEYTYRDDQLSGGGGGESLGSFQFFEPGFMGFEIPVRPCEF